MVANLTHLAPRLEIQAAPGPRPDPVQNRLMVVRGEVIEHLHMGDLPSLLGEGDLLVLNDASTLPASLPGEGLEWRLASRVGPDLWWAVMFGPGDWRLDTDLRPAPGPIPARPVIAGVEVEVVARSPLSARLLLIRVPEGFQTAMFQTGRPVQYSYLAGDLRLEQVQTAIAGPPWAVEAPSAAFALRWRLLDQLRARGVKIATVTHAAGLSATGDPRLDARLPLPERSRVPAATWAALRSARRVIAGGTSAARALESVAANSRAVTALESGQDWEHLARTVLGPARPLRVVQGLLSNIHGPGESHYRLMCAFTPEPRLREAWEQARARGYLNHEFGDGTLLLPTRGGAPG